MLDHVRESTWELGDNPGVAPSAARAALAQVGVRLADSTYRIRHLGHCVVAGREGRHFTIDGPTGIVSFVILPASKQPLAADSLRKDTSWRSTSNAAGCCWAPSPAPAWTAPRCASS